MAALWRDPNFLPHPYFYTRLLFTPAQVLGLLNCNGVVAPEPWQDWLAQIARESEPLDDFTSVSCLESRSYMANTLLRDTDAMSMAHSLEVRVPFLDHPLVEFVSRLPGRVKSADGVPKSLLVEAMGDLLPAEVVSQRKRTFTLPWEHWLRGPLREELTSEFNAIAPSLAACLDAQAVRHVWRSFLEGHISWSRVWSLFVLNKWAQRHLTN
jgi:asparagine synthase (glutamine-hydrolysing)